MIDIKLVQESVGQYVQSWVGVHGLTHWARVLENGRLLAELTGAKIEIVELFAIFHDSKRVTEGLDFKHGPEGARYAEMLRSTYLNFSDEDFDLLYTACKYHTNGYTEGDITVQTCWDADRLDLGRAFIIPNPQYLCTDAAKRPDIIKWANKRSHERVVSDLILNEWGYDLNELIKEEMYEKEI